MAKGQVVNLGSAECLHIGTVLHETMHALGLSCSIDSSSSFETSGSVHEHSRPDRDSHVSILWENVQPGAEHNFQKVSNSTHNARDTPFDLESVMFYGPTDFGIIDDTTGKSKTTIKPLKPGDEIR